MNINQFLTKDTFLEWLLCYELGDGLDSLKNRAVGQRIIKYYAHSTISLKEMLLEMDDSGYYLYRSKDRNGSTIEFTPYSHWVKNFIVCLEKEYEAIIGSERNRTVTINFVLEMLDIIEEYYDNSKS
jgi:hypothetical protein